MKRRVVGSAAVSTALFLGCQCARANTYTFGTSTQGFTAVDFPSGAHSATPVRSAATLDSGNGNPAGSLREGDLYYDTGVATPLTYAGNLNGSYGSVITCDLFLRYTDAVPYKAFAINCGTETLYSRRVSPNLNVWSPTSVQLVESQWSLTSTSMTATKQQFCTLLTAVKGIYFLTEWHSGADDTNIDNITVPPALLSGDATRDGTVGFDDLLILSQNYGTSPAGAPAATWNKGDFDGSGTVAFNDLLALAQHYGQSNLNDQPPGNTRFQSDWALARSIVPEPAFTLVSVSLMLRHRRTRR